MPLRARARARAGRRHLPGLARPRAARRRWRRIVVDDAARTITRPPWLRLDSGGVGKGLAADLVAGTLRGHPVFAVDCAGDMRIGGTARIPRRVLVSHPAGGEPVHAFAVVDGAVATSGVTRRSWRDATGAVRHHILDPSTGQPAWTGVIQATAIAPTALEAETLAKAALLAGPERGRELLEAHGGVLRARRRERGGRRAARGVAAGVAMPFASDYRPFWTGLGVLGGYGLAALSLSYYARARIGVARWRMLHRFVALFWLLGVVHTLGAGTDAGEPWFELLAAIVVVPPLVLLAIRWRSRVSPRQRSRVGIRRRRD